MKGLIAIAIVLSAVSAAECQQAPSFEVASVKPNLSGLANESGHIRAGKIYYENTSLRSLIETAYQVKEYQIAGPNWLASARFDIVAAMPPDTTREQGRLMLQTLLAQRFHLKLRRETRELPVYALVMDKKGSRLKEVNPSGGGDVRSSRSHIEAEGIKMSALAAKLSNLLRRPVLDMTELKGSYSFALDFVPEMESETDPAPGPSIFTAVQEQLGLKLEARKGPVEVLIIERVDKTPSEN